MDKTLFKFKVEQMKHKVKTKAAEAAQWCIDHKEILVVAVPIVIGGTKFIMKETNKIRHDIYEKKMDEEYDRRIYDPSLGVMFRTKRLMSEHDKVTFAKLRDDGMSVYEALEYMKLIE